MLSVLAIIALVIFAVRLFMQGAAFGGIATDERKERMLLSPNYRNAAFRNQHLTPSLAKGVGFFRILYTFFFRKDRNNRPSQPLPSIRTDLVHANAGKDILVWFGHSSYFIRANGKTILVDPVFSGHASPLPFTTRSYAGSDVYTADDMPPIDYLLITHDHWDHLDYDTITALQPKVRQVITGLGTGAHLERWGYAADMIRELDWFEEYMPDTGFVFTALPARHFSGRGFIRNGFLWVSFALTTPSHRIYLGGDSGYDTHFAETGKQYGPFDLAILECGQYNTFWPYIHMQPEETVQAAKDLRAKQLLPVHWAKFSLGLHAWDEPIKRVYTEAQRLQQPLLHPMIGEVVPLDKEEKTFSRWWE